MSKISIALCTYNGEKYLAEQLKSIFEQTVLPDELVINDDVSSDKTVEIINEFSRIAPFPVRLEINTKNLGSTENFERAIERCTGDIIFLCDQDDIWEAEKIELIEKKFAPDESLGMIFSNAVLIDENSNSLNKRLWDFCFTEEKRVGEKMFEVCLRQNAVTGATMAFRAKFREDFLPIPYDIPNMIHDAWISLVIAAQAKVDFIDRDLIKYRQHSGQQLGILNKGETHREKYLYSINFAEGELERLKKLRSILPKSPLSQIRKIQNSEQLIAENLEEISEQIKHYEARKDLPSARLKRIIPILKELKSGRYARFSKGWLSAAKDFKESL